MIQFIILNGSCRYHAHQYTNGTTCDLTNQPRETEVWSKNQVVFNFPSHLSYACCFLVFICRWDLYVRSPELWLVLLQSCPLASMRLRFNAQRFASTRKSLSPFVVQIKRREKWKCLLYWWKHIILCVWCAMSACLLWMDCILGLMITFDVADCSKKRDQYGTPLTVTCFLKIIKIQKWRKNPKNRLLWSQTMKLHLSMIQKSDRHWYIELCQYEWNESKEWLLYCSAF